MGHSWTASYIVASIYVGRYVPYQNYQHSAQQQDAYPAQRASKETPYSVLDCSQPCRVIACLILACCTPRHYVPFPQWLTAYPKPITLRPPRQATNFCKFHVKQERDRFPGPSL